MYLLLEELYDDIFDWSPQNLTKSQILFKLAQRPEARRPGGQRL
jgi:hypothetical protein